MSNKKIIGFDLVDGMPDYSKTPEENEEIFKQKCREAYGEDYFDKTEE